MKCKLKERDEHIRRYLDDEMSDSEMTDFEEHFLNCGDCFKELRNSLQLREFVKSEGSRLFPEFQESYELNEKAASEPEFSGLVNFFRSVLTPGRAAFGLFAVVILLFLFILYEPGSELVTDEVITYNENEVNNAADSADENIISNEIVTEDSTGKLYAANFEESENLELLMDQNYRTSDDLLVISPMRGDVIREEVSFDWTYSRKGQLDLLILDNKEDVLFKFTLRDNGLLFNLTGNELEPGLYYWKLENEDDILYMGKFIYKPE
jgi:hypothetical protein